MLRFGTRSTTRRRTASTGSVPYGSPLLPSRFRVPAYLKRARKRGDAKTKGRENEKTNWFSRFLAAIIQLKSCTKTRQRGYELLNPRPTQTLVFVSAFPRPYLFRFRVPLCFVSAPFSVSFSRVSYISLAAKPTYLLRPCFV